jgi:hypothetical protein
LNRQAQPRKRRGWRAGSKLQMQTISRSDVPIHEAQWARQPWERLKGFLDEWSLQDELRKQNLEKGIAPLSGVVWSQREKCLNAAVAARLVPTASPAKQKHRLQWSRRWRLRWRNKLFTIQARENIPHVECQNKAEPSQSKPYFAYKYQTKGDRRLNDCKKEGPENGPFFGAAYCFFQGQGPQKRPPFFQIIINFSNVRSGI